MHQAKPCGALHFQASHPQDTARRVYVASHLRGVTKVPHAMCVSVFLACATARFSFCSKRSAKFNTLSLSMLSDVITKCMLHARYGFYATLGQVSNGEAHIHGTHLYTRAYV